jgi:hypothetical protein
MAADAPRRIRWGGWMALAGVALFVAVVALLHVVQEDYRAADQLMSELALGRLGSAMLVAFAGLAMGAFGVQLGIGPLGAARALRIVLFTAAIFFLGAGVFTLATAPQVHIAAIACAFVMSGVAMYLFPATAGRAAAFAPRGVSWTAAVGIAASVALGHAILPMGIAQRSAALFLLLWLSILGWRLATMKGEKPA